MLTTKNLHTLPGSPFRPGSNLLVDTCVWLAVSDEKDSWHGVMSDLFGRQILTPDGPALYYTDYIKGEFQNRVGDRSGKVVAQEWWDRWTVKKPGAIRPLSCVLPTTDSVHELQARLWGELDLGHADSLIVAHACYYNVPFLTVDSTTIVQKLKEKSAWFREVGITLTVLYREPARPAASGMGYHPTPKVAIAPPAD